MLDLRQACYRRGHSTETTLGAVTEDIRFAIEVSKVTILIFFDFSKAFDSIPHRRLLQNFRSFYLSNPTITCFITTCNRYQTVINGTLTSWAKSSPGVPQGSILGPLLFTLFISDLPSVLQSVLYMFYADDAQVHGHFSLTEINDGIALMRQNAQAVSDWATHNGLELNFKKTKVMTFGSAQNLAMLPGNLSQIVISG